MKTIRGLLTLIVVVLIVLLLTNKTFIYEVYLNTTTMSSTGITIPRFMYLYDESSTTIKFITPLTYSYVEENKDNYLNNLTTCLGTYYYDSLNNITIESYTITDKSYYRLVTINYSTNNYCSADYTLSDKWLYEYSSSTYISGDITEEYLNTLINKIYESKRVDDPVLTDYESTINIEITLSTDGDEYTIYFSDFSSNELLVKYIKETTTMYAVYYIEDITTYLKGLM